PWVYSGPIGAIITPQYLGTMHEPGLPFASSLCGACAEVCPVKIDIPKVLLDLRSEVKKAETREGTNPLERVTFGVWAWVMCHPRVYERAGRLAGAFGHAIQAGSNHGWMRDVPGGDQLPPLHGWLSERDLPPPPPHTFREMWRRR